MIWVSSNPELMFTMAVDAIASAHRTAIDQKIADLTALRAELDRLLGGCRQNIVADCKIIETLGPREGNSH